MDDAESGVTVGNIVDDDAEGDQVVDTGDVTLVLEQFSVERVEMLGAALHREHFCIPASSNIRVDDYRRIPAFLHVRSGKFLLPTRILLDKRI